MENLRYIISFLITAIIFLLLDALWLGIIAQSLYQEHLGTIINLEFNFYFAGLFYLIYIFGMIYFAEINHSNWKKSLKRGIILGGLCYATYDFTNWATIKDWPYFIVIIDVVWGMLITGLTAGLSSWILSKITIKS